jgi:hypothetical protein
MKRKSCFIGELKIHSKIFKYNFFSKKCRRSAWRAPKNHKVLTLSPEESNPNKLKFMHFFIFQKAVQPIHEANLSQPDAKRQFFDAVLLFIPRLSGSKFNVPG